MGRHVVCSWRGMPTFVRTRCHFLFVLAAFASVLPHSAFAQQGPPPPPPAREGTAEFAFVGTSGNSSTQALGLGGEVTFRPSPWVFNSKAAYVRNEADDVVEAESFAALFQASRAIRPRLSTYGRYAYLRNTFAGIEHRNSISGGLEYEVLTGPVHLLKTNAGIGYANEQRVIVEDLSTAEFLTGAGYKWVFSPTADLTNDFNLSMSFEDAGDWRMANIVALTAKLTTLLSLKLTNTVRYVNEPVEGFDTTDTLTSVALVAKF
jgi:putative salt-induced outer membrane protein